MMSNFHFRCPTCQVWQKEIPIQNLSSTADITGACKSGHAWSVRGNEALSKNQFSNCPLCESPDVYVQKDVPKNIFLMTLVPALLFAFFMLDRNWWLGMGVLGGLAFLDLILFLSLKDALVCYGCEATIHPWVKRREDAPHDHHISERYRQMKKAASV